MQDSRSDSLVSPRLFAVTTTPLVLLIIASGVLFVQVLRMRAAAQWLEHSEKAISWTLDAERRIHEQHAAVLSRLLGDRSEQAELAAETRAREALRTLEQHLEPHDAAQVEQVRQVTGLHRIWSRYARRLEPAPSATGQTQQLYTLLAPALEGLQSIEREERRVSARRAEELAALTGLTIYGALPLLLLFSLAVGGHSRRQILKLAGDFSRALAGQEAARAALDLQSWVRERLVSLIASTRDEANMSVVGSRFLNELTQATGAVVGAFYYFDGERWVRRAAHGLSDDAPETFDVGEGLLGQAATRPQSVRLRQLPEKFFFARSATGSGAVHELALIPCHYEDTVLAVVELGFFDPPSERAERLIEQAGESMGVAVAVTRKREIQRTLLKESKMQAEALQSQQEELRVTNEELASQSEALRFAHAQLEERKEELEASNSSLVRQRDALAKAQEALAARALELKRANRYKSEFLASMSHELRTPLNSCLILSKALAENKSGNLTEEQVKFAETIYASGRDLLELINDVLDLSKIEAGAVEMNFDDVQLAALLRPVVRITEPLAKERGLELKVELAQPDAIVRTDSARVQQILKNLLSNACKFTKRGSVTLRVDVDDEGVSFCVEDTGIGIAEDKLEAIFEAFRQADGRISRGYGGTGLGLTISRDLAKRLGGEIGVTSKVGEGSKFTLRLPRRPQMEAESSADQLEQEGPDVQSLSPRVGSESKPPTGLGSLARKALEDDLPFSPRSRPSNPVVLLIQTDDRLNERMATMARSWGFDCVVAKDAESGLAKAASTQPRAIVVEESLAKEPGASILSQLKRDEQTRDIPVHVITTAAQAETALSLGAVGYLKKPVDEEALREVLQKLTEQNRRPRVLVVEDDEAHRTAVQTLLAERDVDVEAVGTVAEALEAVSKTSFACVVLDLHLPDGSGQELLRSMARDDSYSFPSVVVYTGKELTPAEEQELRRYSDTIILKGVRSEDRLLDELTMFLHEVDSAIGPSERRAQLRPRSNEMALRGKRVLLVEDDIRNVYALTSVLEKQGVEVSVARNGKEALHTLHKKPDLELVLIDIMMPEMDGLEATRRIRSTHGPYKDIPIIALTAKAMRDDREACLEAGANDYVTKPIDAERLLSLMRIWLKPS